MILSPRLAFASRLTRQQVEAVGGGGQPPSLLDDVRRVILGRDNLDMTEEAFLIHYRTELQEHVTARIREYEAMITVIGYLSGAVTPPPPMTSEGLRQQVTDAISEMGGSLIERSQRSGLDNLNPLNAIPSAVGVYYGILGGAADLLGSDDAAESYYGTARTALNTDIVALYNNSVNDLVNAIVQGLTDYWDRFWAEVDTNGFLIAYGKLRIDAGFLAAELAIDIALGAVTGGAGAAASRVIRVVGRRVAGTVTRVTVKIGNVGDVIPDSRRVLEIDVDDADIPDEIERLLDEDSLGGAGPLDDTAGRTTPIPPTGATTVVRGHGDNMMTVTTDPDSGRPVSVRATLRDDAGANPRHDNATEIGRTGNTGDHGGHIIAHRFMGDVPDEGIVPQAGNLNTGAWKTMENELADWIAYGRANNRPVEIEVLVELDPPGAVRPDRFEGDYRIYEILPDGSRRLIHEDVIDMENQPGQTFDRVYFRTDPDGSMHIRE